MSHHRMGSSSMYLMPVNYLKILVVKHFKTSHVCMVIGVTNSWLFMERFMISFATKLVSANLKWLTGNRITNSMGTESAFDFHFKCTEMINGCKNRISVHVQRLHREPLLTALYIMRTAWFQYRGIQTHYMEVKLKRRLVGQKPLSLVFWRIHLRFSSFVLMHGDVARVVLNLWLWTVIHSDSCHSRYSTYVKHFIAQNTWLYLK
jgi:hypothetical protein